MCDIRLIALDLDGTLLMRQKTISPEDIGAVAKAGQSGITIALCTGRNYADARYFAKTLGIPDVWGVTANGAYIREIGAAEPIFERGLDSNLTDLLLKLCRTHGLSPCLHTPFCEYTGSVFNSVVAYLEDHGISTHVNSDSKCVPVADGDWLQVAKKEKGLFTKAILYHRSVETVDETQALLKRYDEFCVSPSVMFEGKLKNLEVNRAGVSKGAALKRLTAHLGFSMENVLAIGDSENDITMLRDSGYSAAMGNAAQQIKSVAQLVTLDNESGGVAYAINKFVFS